MKFGLTLLLANIPAICAISAAAWLAFSEKPGWGWFLLVGVLVMQVVRSSSFKEL